MLSTVKPKTLIGILEEIENCLRNMFSSPESEKQLAALGLDLLQLCQGDLLKFQSYVAGRGEPWEGEIVLTASANEQDGLVWSHREKVEIKDGEVSYCLVSNKSSCWTSWQQEIEETTESVEWVMSKDEASLKRVSHRTIVGFRRGGIIEQLRNLCKETEDQTLVLERVVTFTNNRISEARVVRNLASPPSKTYLALLYQHA